jgi:hypothetical protein
MTATAPSVSAALRRAGLNPAGSRTREGLRVSRYPTGGAHVSCDLLNHNEAAAVLEDARTALLKAGYSVSDSRSFAALIVR